MFAFGLTFIIFFTVGLSGLEEIKAQNQPRAKLFLSPSTGSFLVGSTFDVSIIVNTDGVPVNTVEVNLKFPQDMLQIVTPSSGKSFLSIWLEQPVYSNTEGILKFSGGTPEGINTSSGIVSTITFRAIKAGEANIKILPPSNVLAHDGKGTKILSEAIGGNYTLMPKPPDGPRVFSQTHPDETRWYNNNNPIISWEKESGITDFSFILDNYPQTVPDNSPDSQETTKNWEELTDGLWYFHIKAKKEGVWGAPSHYLLRIDTTRPASFKPRAEFLLAAIISRAFVSFSTTDALSGIDHYEIAVIDKTEPPLESPVFIEAESPYQLPKLISGYLRIVVRAIDKAGNVRDETLDTKFPEPFFTTIKNNGIFVIFPGALVLIFVYLIVRLLRRGRKTIINIDEIKKGVKKEQNND